MKNEKKVQFAFKGETVTSHPKWLSTLFTNTAHLSIIMPHSPLTARDYLVSLQPVVIYLTGMLNCVDVDISSCVQCSNSLSFPKNPFVVLPSKLMVNDRMQGKCTQREDRQLTWKAMTNMLCVCAEASLWIIQQRRFCGVASSRGL